MAHHTNNQTFNIKTFYSYRLVQSISYSATESSLLNYLFMLGLTLAAKAATTGKSARGNIAAFASRGRNNIYDEDVPRVCGR